MDYAQIVRHMLSYIGGKANVVRLTHCFTRLRFVLKDEDAAQKNAIAQLEGVISVVVSGGEFQVVCGAKVVRFYEALMGLLESEADVQGKALDTGEQRQKPLSAILQKITEIFTPLVPAIAASGLIKGILAVCARLPGFDTANSSYIIMNTASNVIFYFMPVFLAYTAARALKCSIVVALMLGAFLCHPAIDALMQDVGSVSTIFGLPVSKVAFSAGEVSRVFTYTESVIPVLLAVYILSLLERFLTRRIPDMLQLILVPGISLIVMIPLLLVVLGPVGIYAGYLIQWLYTALYGFSPVLGGIIVGGLWGVCVIFGAHRALIPIGLNDVAMTGTNTLMCFAGAANFSQAGAALGVMLKTRNKDFRQAAAAASLSAWLVGVTEPAIYGCNLRLKKPMICAIIAGALGGAVMGLGRAVNTGFANNGILTIMSYWGEGVSFGRFMAYIAGIVLAFVGSAVLTYIVGFDDSLPKGQPLPEGDTLPKGEPISKGVPREQAEVKEREDFFEIASPVSGRVRPLTEVPDEAFASGALGQGVIIVPDRGAYSCPG